MPKGNRTNHPGGYHDPAWVKAKQQEMLAYLQDGTPPFLALAADRAGVNRNTAKTWLHQADHNPGHTHTEWSLAVRKIRGEWMAQISKFLLSTTDKIQVEQAKQAVFLLGRMDADLFDPPKRQVERTAPVAKDTPDQKPATPAEAQAVADALAQPEDESTPNMH